MGTPRTQLFVSYSHHDRQWLERLQVHLRPLVRSATIELWDDTRIQPGSEWRRQIADALSHTKVAILLVSADFLASDFIAEHELPPLLEAARDEGVIVLPVIVSASGYQRNEDLRKFQAVNDVSRPLNGLPESDQEAVFETVAEHVERAIGQQELRARFGIIRDQLDDQRRQLQAQQATINELVKYLVAAPIFRHLCGIALLRQYQFWDGPMARELYFLRDIGFIQPKAGDFVSFDARLNGANLSELVEPTPIGWSCIRLRQAEVPREWLHDPTLRSNLREDMVASLEL